MKKTTNRETMDKISLWSQNRKGFLKQDIYRHNAQAINIGKINYIKILNVYTPK